MTARDFTSLTAAAAWDDGAATALGECLGDGIEFTDADVKRLYAKNPHRVKAPEPCGEQADLPFEKQDLGNAAASPSVEAEHG